METGDLTEEREKKKRDLNKTEASRMNSSGILIQ